MIVKTDDLKDNVCTYMEALKKTRDKLNEVIDYINHSNLTPLYHYNFYLEITADSEVLTFDLYTRYEVDHSNLSEFVENYDENFDVMCNGTYDGKDILSLTFDRENEKFILYYIDGQTDLSFSDISDAEIVMREV